MAALSDQNEPHLDQSVVVGTDPTNSWSFAPATGWDLTHSTTPSTTSSTPRITLETTTAPITIDPSKSALVIIDMQNFFLSTALGNPKGDGHKAEEKLLSEAIPAAEQAGIQVIHITWGINEEELAVLPPILHRCFGFNLDVSKPNSLDRETKLDRVIGRQMGKVSLPDGAVVDAGRLLMLDQWNTEIHDPLLSDFKASQERKQPHLRFHKNRLSGLWGNLESNPFHTYLKEKGITTLLFTGVNTDQCVLSSLQDASHQGFDTVLLTDGCATTSPQYATEAAEFNCGWVWGFVSSCGALGEGVKEAGEKMK
ncbi:Nn.00g079130.m01.CDS01 [Neocucurbitaria sp. VM-36]